MTEMSEPTIRLATPDDAPALLAIYEPYVRQTAITCEYEVPSVEEFAGRIERTLKRYPYLVMELDGRPVGYAYVSSLNSREAYDWSVETSIYLARDVRHGGLGRKLHDALKQCLIAMGITNMCALIAVPHDKDDEYLTHNSQDSMPIWATAWWVRLTAVPRSSAAGTTCAGWSWSWPSASLTNPNQPGSPTSSPKTTTMGTGTFVVVSLKTRSFLAR